MVVYRWMFFALAALLLSGSVVQVSAKEAKIIEDVLCYEEHDPISIEGDVDLLIQKILNQWDGLGTEDNPIIIEGYSINAEKGTCIGISNTTLCFIVRGCELRGFVYDEGDWDSRYEAGNGILLDNVESASIFNIELIGSVIRISMKSVREASIKYCKFSEYLWNAVRISSSQDVEISGCIISPRDKGEECEGVLLQSGFYISESSDCSITQNVIDVPNDGIEVIACSRIFIEKNEILYTPVAHWTYGGGGEGILLGTVNRDDTPCEDIIIRGNDIRSCFMGVSNWLESRDGIIRDSVISNNTFYKNTRAINFENAKNLSILDNTFFDNDHCVDFESVTESVIKSNIFKNNSVGLRFDDDEFSDMYCDYNLIYNNYFANNTFMNVWLWQDNRNNRWNVEKISGKNIIGGVFLGGNYWDDYEGIDDDGDGIGDTLLPYGPGDYSPLVIPGQSGDGTEEGKGRYVGSNVITFVFIAGGAPAFLSAVTRYSASRKTKR